MKIRVLVVDDYSEHVQTLVSTLNMYGADAQGVESPSKALKICRSWRPHLVIYDGLMEGMRAWQFSYELLKKDPKERPYLVALTGFGSTLQRRLCEECGYDEYVTKPIELSALLAWVQKAKKNIGVAHDESDQEENV